MLKKLIKYDTKWTLKNIYIFIGLGLFFGIVARLLDLAPDSLFFKIVKGIFKGASLSMTISALVNSIIRPWVRMELNMYKDQAYLTHTIPVSRSIIYLSKFLNALICIVLSSAVLLIDLFIMYYSKETIETLKLSLNMLATTLDVSVVLFIVLVSFVVLVEALFIVQCGYFGIVYGNSYNKNKGAKTFIYGFASYIVSTFVTLIVLIIWSLFDKELHGVVFGGNSNIDFSLIKVLMIFSIIIYVIYIMVLYYLSNKKLTKGINID